MKHTQGEWKFAWNYKDDIDRIIVYTECEFTDKLFGTIYIAEILNRKKEPIARDDYLGIKNPYPLKIEAEVNARLIVSAPKMLDLLKEYEIACRTGKCICDAIEFGGSSDKCPFCKRIKNLINNTQALITELQSNSDCDDKSLTEIEGE